jgi:predicted GIY-YIG superfamily endonuclease
LCGAHFYVGMTSDLDERLKLHNAGKVTHSAEHATWHFRTFIAFTDRTQALSFERYLSASCRAFATKRF